MKISLSIVPLSCLVVACGGGAPATDSEPGAASAQVIKADGSSTVFPVTEAVAEEFNADTRIQVTVGVSGTGGGFQKFCRGEIDVANASRPITRTEADACAAAGISYIEIPVAYDGLAVVVHPNNTWAESMTVAELRKLWEPGAQGKVMRWSDVRAGWPNEEIHLFGAGVDSGTFDYFTEVIVGKTDQSRGDYTSSENDNLIVQGVSGDQHALGYFGYAYYEENKDKLKLVGIDDGDDRNGKGPVRPSPETVKNGTYRPLSRPIFIYPKLTSLERPEVKRFVDYYLTEGIALIGDVGYIPLTDREYEMVRSRVAAMKAGTMYTEGSGNSQVTLEQRLAQ